MIRTVEQSAMRKVYLRVLPFAALTYFFCYLDRINVGFAALTMNKDLGLDPAMYGMAAGAFFWGYVLFEVPSNIILEKLGARLWIARIMVTWGIVSGLTAFATGPYSFMAIRFLLGLAEAGLFPGFVLYFTYWFPDAHRARINSGFTLALPIAVASGAPVSTALLGLNGLFGLRGWQVMFIFEAIPTIVIGIVAFFYLTDRPSVAPWLSAEEKGWLERTIGGEQRQIEAHHGIGLLRSFFDPKVLLLSLNYIGIVTASLGLLLFLPQIIKQLGVTNMMTGVLVSLPYVIGSISMIAWGYVSDRMNERRWNLVISCGCAFVGMVAVGYTVGTWWALLAMCLATIGFYGMKPVFWPLPSQFLSGTAAAGGIAIINSIGNLGGFFGPMLLGWVKETTGGYSAGIYVLAGCALVSTVLALGVPGRKRTAHPRLGEVAV